MNRLTAARRRRILVTAANNPLLTRIIELPDQMLHIIVRGFPDLDFEWRGWQMNMGTVENLLEADSLMLHESDWDQATAARPATKQGLQDLLLIQGSRELRDMPIVNHGSSIIEFDPGDAEATLANQLILKPRQVLSWFQNRRTRTKFKRTEVDCEVLKKSYESLTENKRLQKELAEMRALK